MRQPHPTIPRPTIPRPAIPRPTIPRPAIPRPTIPRPTIPGPMLPGPRPAPRPAALLCLAAALPWFLCASPSAAAPPRRTGDAATAPAPQADASVAPPAVASPGGVPPRGAPSRVVHPGVASPGGAAAGAAAPGGVPLSVALVRVPPPGGQTLLEALGAAYLTNPDLLAARARLRDVDEGVTQAASPWRPHVTVDATAGVAAYDNSIDKLRRPENRTPQNYQLRVSQDVFTSGRVASEVAQAKARVAAQRGMLAAAEATVLLAAGNAFVDVVRDRALLALRQHAVLVSERAVRAGAVQLASGAITPADLARMQARLNERQAEASFTAAQLQTSEATFEQQVGEIPGPLRLPAAPPAPAGTGPSAGRGGADPAGHDGGGSLGAVSAAAAVASTGAAFAAPSSASSGVPHGAGLPEIGLPLPAGREAAVARALLDNPDLVAARGTLEATRLGVDIARDSLLPQVSLHAILERRRQYEYQTYAQGLNAAEGLVEVLIPLYQGGAEFSRIRQAKEQTTDAANRVQRALRAARQQTLAAWAGLEAGRDRLLRYRQAQQADEVALDGIARQQRVGARTVVDVLDAEQAVLGSEADAVVAEHDALVQALRVLDAVGALDATDLRLDVPVYDPGQHYREVRDKWIGTTPPPEPLPPYRDPDLPAR